MPSTKVAVLIPNHKGELNELEKISLDRCRKILGRYPLIHVVPEGKIFSYFAPGEMIVHFPAEYFQTIKGYNLLSISPLFYEPFLDFDYILIYQLDAFVFYDALEEFCALGYDYIGAPLPKIFSVIVDGLRFSINNSGFCLRKVAACHKLLSDNADLIERHHELPDDVFFSYCGARPDIDFNVAPIKVANVFAVEMNFERTIRKNGGILPFGCHAWPKLDAEFYVELFKRFGCNFQLSGNELGDGNSEFMLNKALTIVALFRLDRRVRGGKSLLRYLPTNHFAAVVIVRDKMTVRILKQLLNEEKFFCEEIIDCNVDELEKIFSVLPLKELPYLFIGAQENYKTHGRCVVSFRQEYLKSCEELFHRLGKETSDESCKLNSDNQLGEKILPSTKVAVVIPVYRELDQFEKFSLAQCRKVLERYPLIFVAPEGKNFSYFEAGDMVANFPAEYFQSTQTYSRLMLTPQFYETFLDFDYILIYQLDAFVFYDALEEFCSLGYDYIGAPWPYLVEVDKKFLRVGNGGFSLRNVKAHYKLLLNHADLVAQHENLNEDAILSYCGTKTGFSVAPIEVAYKFSMERNPDRCIRKNGGNLPFGCHGWSTLTEDFYVKNFWTLFLDTRTIESLQLKPEDKLSNWLCLVAIKRFNRRLQNGRSLLRYLPTKNFASICVIRSPAALKILSQLLKDENSLTDKIFIRDMPEDLLQDVTGENLPHLIISAAKDAPLIEAFERSGLRYGENFLSFQREYMKRCEELFHKLGK